MHALPRSRTLPMLRTPAPFRLLATVLALSGLCAASIGAMPALSDRARLAAALIDATITRMDPLLEHAHNGRWSSARPIPSPLRGDTADALVRRVTADGIAITQARRHDRVDLALNHTVSRGDTIFWRCEVRAAEGGAPVVPLSLPAGCRE